MAVRVWIAGRAQAPSDTSSRCWGHRLWLEPGRALPTGLRAAHTDTALTGGAHVGSCGCRKGIPYLCVRGQSRQRALSDLRGCGCHAVPPVVGCPCLSVALWYGPTVRTQHKGTLPTVFAGSSVCSSANGRMRSVEGRSLFSFLLLLFQAAVRSLLSVQGMGQVSAQRGFFKRPKIPTFVFRSVWQQPDSTAAACGMVQCVCWHLRTACHDSVCTLQELIPYCSAVLRWSACAPLLLSDCAKCSQPANMHV